MCPLFLALVIMVQFILPRMLTILDMATKSGNYQYRGSIFKIQELKLLT